MNEADKWILNRAAWIIETAGHCKKRYRDGDKRCALGAIHDAMTAYDNTGCQAYSPIKHLYAKVGDVVGWNDADDRTAAEVVATLRELAA